MMITIYSEQIMHVSLPKGNSAILMDGDISKSIGHVLIESNIIGAFHPGSIVEAERLFKTLPAGGKVIMPLEKMFWGAYFASFADKFGILWMINYEGPGK